MIRTKNHGYEFVEFIRMQESEMDNYSPLAGSFAVIECKGNYLLCYNIWRQQWEIPAGKREADETPKECAIRELCEETGQQVDDMEFLGILKKKRVSNQTMKHNPAYFKKVDELKPFRENDETSKILLWDLNEDIGYIDEVDVKVFDYI
ncbi:NUDIX domain-containing protein [Virgibacillus kekensis]|uniref:NUDIX domain-containing protein n=1 Tax=Virgibacillus kekensis TaxID=202261 RepID=A0ABV9DM92_9BACI